MADISKLYSNQFSGSLYTVKTIVGVDSQYFVFVYADGGNSSYGTAVVGKYDGSTITYGTPVVFSSSNTGMVEAIKIADGKIAIIYENNSNWPSTIVGQLSDMDITFGTPVVLDSSTVAPSRLNLCYLEDDKYFVSYNYGLMRVCQVSGNSITTGAQFNEPGISQGKDQACSSYDGSRVYVAWAQSSTTQYCKSYNVTGITITAGSTLTNCGINDADKTFTIEALPDNKVVLFQRQTNNIRAALFEWVGDGSDLVYLDNTPTGAFPVYSYQHMYDTVRVSDTQVNMVYTTSSGFTYYLVQFTIDGDSVSIGTPVDMQLGTGVGLSQVSLLGSNTIATQGSEYHVVATTGVDSSVITNFDVLSDITVNNTIEVVKLNNYSLESDITTSSFLDFGLVRTNSAESNLVISSDLDYKVIRTYKFDIYENLNISSYLDFEFISNNYNGKENFTNLEPTYKFNSTSSIVFDISINSKIN